MATAKPLFPRSAIVVFAREPLAGKVKTRLGLPPQQAADCYRQMLLAVLQQVFASKLARVRLYWAGNLHCDFIKQLRSQYDFDLLAQQGGDLGVRMAQAVKESLQDCSSLVLIGTDCPEMQPEDLLTALDFLQGDQPSMVLQPAYDGGYVLIGANYDCSAVFSGIDWSTERVLRQTLQKVPQSVQLKQLEPLGDIDTLEDWHRWQSKLDTGANNN